MLEKSENWSKVVRQDSSKRRKEFGWTKRCKIAWRTGCRKIKKKVDDVFIILLNLGKMIVL